MVGMSCLDGGYGSNQCPSIYYYYYYYYLRAVGRKVLWSSACLSVCLCALFCPQDISRTGSWITTKFGGWEQGVNL